MATSQMEEMVIFKQRDRAIAAIIDRHPYTNLHVQDVQAPTHTRVWQDLVCLTGSLARMGYFTTKGSFNHDGRPWRAKCRRNKASYLPPKQSIWPWAE